MDQIIESGAEDWQVFISFAPRLVVALAALIVFYLLGSYLSKFVLAVLRRASAREIHENFFRVLTITVALFVGLVVALNILGLEKVAVSVLAGGGVTAIVLGFAFREIGENFLAGIFLAFSRPFKLGDLIRTEDIEGYVREIELRYTHLRTEDGRDVYVPSSQLFGRPVTNFTRDGLVGIDYANDARKACELLRDTTGAVADVLGEPKPAAFIQALAAQYVELQVFFWIDVFDKTRDILSVQTEVMNACRQALLDQGYTVSAETTSNIALKNGKNEERQE
jgi:small conductance mechanosensitive channel